MSPTTLAQGIREADALGCKLYYFTGGEPLLYPGLTKMLATLLKDQEKHAIILTNGLLLPDQIQELLALPSPRLHLQISLDGLEEQHDRIRGPGTFSLLMDILDTLVGSGLQITLSIAINRINYLDLPSLTRLAANKGIRNIHLLWHFIRGKGKNDQFVSPAEIFPLLTTAQEIAEEVGVSIDNIETIRSQVFSSPGTRFDLSNAAWESLAIDPDGTIYPSPALIGESDLASGNLADGLDTVWRSSALLTRIRQTSLSDSIRTATDPFRFLIGGGDIDHSYVSTRSFIGGDPYLELYEQIALWLISRQAALYTVRNPNEIQLRMGDVRHDCPDGGAEVSLTHCNCVISLATEDQDHSAVREFYGQAARVTNDEIINPFGPTGSGLHLIPEDAKTRSYGCGSPVRDAELRPGETMVDLGSGSGVECFLAATEVGPEGRVYGIDMTEEMLNLAQRSKDSVVQKLGYDNIDFRQGFLERIPLADNSVDAVISNCVINLSPDKRRTYHEIFRILKPGGRLVVSDIVTDRPIPITIKNNAQFRGECLGGAMQLKQLMAMLRSAGFTGTSCLKRFFYRQEKGADFFSLTYKCFRPKTSPQLTTVMYRGPMAGVILDDGSLLMRGEKQQISEALLPRDDDSFFLFDLLGNILNQQGPNCCTAGSEMVLSGPVILTGSDCCR